MKSNSNTISIVIITLIVIAGIYWFFFKNKEQPPLLPNGTESQAQTQFQVLVGKLTPISFNTSIFSDERFNSLVDISTTVAPEPSGRLDPFAVVTSISGN